MGTMPALSMVSGTHMPWLAFTKPSSAGLSQASRYSQTGGRSLDLALGEIKHRLAVLRHAAEVSAEVALMAVLERIHESESPSRR